MVPHNVIGLGQALPWCRTSWGFRGIMLGYTGIMYPLPTRFGWGISPSSAEWVTKRPNQTCRGFTLFTFCVHVHWLESWMTNPPCELDGTTKRYANVRKHMVCWKTHSFASASLHR